MAETNDPLQEKLKSLMELVAGIPKDSAELAELKTKVEYLYGNGKPGKVDELVKSDSAQNKWLWMLAGALTVIAQILAWLVPQVVAHIWK